MAIAVHCQKSVQLCQLGQYLFRSSLLKAFADQVLSTADERSCIRLYYAHLLEQIVKHEKDTYRQDVMCFMQLNEHTTVVLDRCETDYGVVDQTFSA